MLSVTPSMVGDKLVVNGDNYANTIVVTMNPATSTAPQSAVVMAEGKTWKFACVNNLKIDARGGNDYVEVRGKGFKSYKGVEVLGGDGNDRINFTNLYLQGGTSFGDGLNGDDKLYASPSGSQLEGGWGNDSLYGGNAGDYLLGNEGNDYITGNGGHDRLLGEAGCDYLHGGDGNDMLDGGADNDQLNGGNGDDKLYGGYGNDKLYGEGGWDYLNGGEGTDEVWQ